MILGLRGKLKQTHLWSSSVHLQGSNSRHQHHHVGPQARVATLDVEELLHANVSTKASLRHCWAQWTGVVRKREQQVRIIVVKTATYPQSPRVQPVSKPLYQPGWRSCHGRCWQTGRRGQTQAFPVDSDTKRKQLFSGLWSSFQ